MRFIVQLMFGIVRPLAKGIHFGISVDNIGWER